MIHLMDYVISVCVCASTPHILIGLTRLKNGSCKEQHCKHMISHQVTSFKGLNEIEGCGIVQANICAPCDLVFTLLNTE